MGGGAEYFGRIVFAVELTPDGDTAQKPHSLSHMFLCFNTI